MKKKNSQPSGTDERINDNNVFVIVKRPHSHAHQVVEYFFRTGSPGAHSRGWSLHPVRLMKKKKMPQNAKLEFFFQAATKTRNEERKKGKVKEKGTKIVIFVFHERNEEKKRKRDLVLTRDKVWHGNVSGTCFFLGQRLRHEALPEFGILDLQLVQLLRHVAADG